MTKDVQDNANLKVNGVDEDLVQSGFDGTQGWRSHRLSRQSLAVFCHPHCGEHMQTVTRTQKKKFVAVAVVT